MSETEQAIPNDLHAREKPGLEDLVLSLLLSGKSVGQVCSQTSMSRSALWRMRQKPEFQRRFAEARADAFRGAVMHCTAARWCSCELCATFGQSPIARLVRASVARPGLDSLWNAAKLFDFEDRLRKLEGSRIEAK